LFSTGERILLRLDELRLLRAQGRPCAPFSENAVGRGPLDGRRRGRFGGRAGMSGGGVLLRGFVLIEQLLNGGLLIAARADQIIVRVLKLVLIERKLCLKDAESLLVGVV